MKIYTVEIASCITCPNCVTRSGTEYCLEADEQIWWDRFLDDCPLPDLEETQCK